MLGRASPLPRGHAQSTVPLWGRGQYRDVAQEHREWMGKAKKRDRLEKWADKKILNFITDKHKVWQLGENNPMQ